MLNQKPIFIVGFTRGGTNLLLNLLRSHPDVCSPRGETQEVFRGKANEPFWVRNGKRLRYLPIMLMERDDVFSLRNWKPRRLSAFTRWWADRILFAEKLKARAPDQNLYRAEAVKYRPDEIQRARLLCKNLNGLILLSREFHSMYPDATFLAIVRDGFAVCEGHIRRGMPVETIAWRYERGCRQIIDDAEHISGYHIITYENLVTSPRECLEKIYTLAGLDMGKVTKIRLQHKPVIDRDGKHRSSANDEAVSSETDARHKEIFWYKLDEFGRFFRTDANENQRRRLAQADARIIAERCRSSLKHFGYM